MAAAARTTKELAQAVRRQWPAGAVRVGVDAVAVGNIEESLASFGERFVRRMFTPHEILAANGSAERLAARFAVKEAVIKAFDLSEVGIDWRDIELRSDASGRPGLRLFGRALASARASGAGELSVSLAHENGMAFAVVIAVLESNARARVSVARTATT